MSMLQQHADCAFKNKNKNHWNSVWANLIFWDQVDLQCFFYLFIYFYHLHLYLSLNRGSRWGTTDDFKLVFSIFLCSPLPSGTLRTPGLSIPWCCLPTFFPVRPIFSLSLSLSPPPPPFTGPTINATLLDTAVFSKGKVSVVFAVRSAGTEKRQACQIAQQM